MKRQKKITLFICFLLVLVFAFTGCSKNTKNNDKADTQTATSAPEKSDKDSESSAQDTASTEPDNKDNSASADDKSGDAENSGSKDTAPEGPAVNDSATTEEGSGDNASPDKADSTSESDDNTVQPLTVSVGRGYNHGDYNDSYQKIAYVSCDRAFVVSDCYDRLNNTLTDIYNDLLIASKDHYERCLEYALAEYADESFWGPYFYETKLSTPRADSTVTSLLIHSDNYPGGAHPVCSYGSVVLDSKTGAILSLKDVLNDEYTTDGYKALSDMIKERLTKDFAGIDYIFFTGTLEEETYFSEALGQERTPWTLDYDGITFYYSSYEIAPYSNGSQSVKIPFKGNEQLFKAQYLEVPSAYTIQLTPHNDLVYDLDDDGNPEYIYFYESMYEGYIRPENEDNLHIWTSNEGLFENPVCQYSAFEYEDSYEPVFVHTDGHNFLYLTGTGPSNMKCTYCFELYPDHVEQRATISGSPDTAYNYSDYYINNIESSFANDFDYDNYYDNFYFESCGMFNPDDCLIYSRGDIFGTTFETLRCRIDSEGHFVAADEYYYLAYCSYKLKLLKELTFDTVDVNGNTTGQVTLAAGSFINVERGDRKGVVDCTTESLDEGTYLRIVFDESEIANSPHDEDLYIYFHTINGEDMEVLFEGISFAG